MSVFGLKLESGCTKLLICSNSGADKEIDVIDVSRQCDLKMRLGDFVEYYNSPNRERTLNVISLEFSHTKLENLIKRPTVVRSLRLPGG